MEGNRRFEVCVFVYLEADCPRDIETSKIRRKTSRSKNTSVVDIFCNRGEYILFSIHSTVDATFFDVLSLSRLFLSLRAKTRSYV